MKVVVLGRDFATYDSGALKLLEDYGLEVIEHSCRNLSMGSSEEDVIAALGDAEIAIVGLEPYNEKVFSQCPNLKMLSRRGIGYDSIDLAACKKRGITVTRTVGMVEAPVAEHVIAYLFYFARHLEEQNRTMHEHKWKRTMMPGLQNQTLGLIGFGGIGKEIAKRAVALGMEVLYYCRHPKKEWNTDFNVIYTPLDELLAKSDYVSLNVPLTPATENMCDEKFFTKMKKDSVFINIARGQIVDNNALAKVLLSSQLRGAGVDVFASEPCKDSPLHSCPTAVLTPHTAPFTISGFSGMNYASAENVIKYLEETLDPKNKLI